jgi:nitric oxide synthase oxygenase domain/subunit
MKIREKNNYFWFALTRANSENHLKRWKSVQKEIEATGTYELTETELIYGAKLAWRNAQRCIGRIQWQKLQVCYQNIQIKKKKLIKLHQSTHMISLSFSSYRWTYSSLQITKPRSRLTTHLRVQNFIVLKFEDGCRFQQGSFIEKIIIYPDMSQSNTWNQRVICFNSKKSRLGLLLQ